jgi:hypothetical protein
MAMADEWDDWESDDDGHCQAGNAESACTANADIEHQSRIKHERYQHYYDLLKDFQLNLADAHVREGDINDRLAVDITFRDFMTYYTTNTKLASYTIETELKRMEFVCIHNGQRLSDHDAIVALYEQTPLDDMWKLANQVSFGP